MKKKELKPIVCKGCALMLAMRCYEKHWWFRLIREPLVLGMRFLGFINGIKAYSYPVKQSECKGCIRFLKAELERKSPTFNFLNKFIGPWFANVRNGMLTSQDMEEAKEIAKKAME